MLYYDSKGNKGTELVLGKEKEIIMRSTTMMREMNMRRVRAYVRSMSISPCFIMPENNMRSGGNLMKE